MHEDLQQAIVSLLAAGLAPLSVFGAVPQDQAYPYVVVSEADSTQADTDDSDGELVRMQVRLFRAASEVARATEFIDRAKQLLHHTESLTLTTADVVTVYMEGSAVEGPSDDGKARETVVTVAILVDDITPGTD